VRLDTNAVEFFDHKPPAGTALESEGDVIVALEPLKPLTKMTPIGRRDPPAAHLAGLRVQIVKRDLAPMKVESAYDAHWGPP
jgi:hypothetical protein